MSTRHILITGASGGMGQALALAYATPNVHLTLLGRDPSRLHDIADHCRQAGAEVSEACLDMRESGIYSDWLSNLDRKRPVDLAIANAGVSSSIGRDGQAEATEDVRRLFAVNTMGVVETAQALAEPMRTRGHGQLALVSSLAAMAPLPDGPAYCGSKAAVRLYGLSLRFWLAPYGVKVTVISPGYVDTSMSRRYHGAKPFTITPEHAARIISRGLARNRAEIAFPALLVHGLRLLNLLPPWLQGQILKRSFRFSVQPDKDSPLSR